MKDEIVTSFRVFLDNRIKNTRKNEASQCYLFW